MSLSANVLRDEIRKITDESYAGFEGFPTLASAPGRWATAYDVYGSSAEDVSGDSVATKSKPGFQDALDFDLSNTAAISAEQFKEAVIAYWTGATFAVGILLPLGVAPCLNAPPLIPFASETTSIVTVITPPLMTVFEAGLEDEFLGLSGAGTAEEKAQDLADLFHGVTTAAVIVTIVGIGPIPASLPVSNICTVS